MPFLKHVNGGLEQLFTYILADTCNYLCNCIQGLSDGLISLQYLANIGVWFICEWNILNCYGLKWLHTLKVGDFVYVFFRF